MFREMRRIKQQLNNDDSIKVIKNNTYGVLAVLGDYGYPYTIPLNYVYFENKLYLHSAKKGHKIDAILKNQKVSFCIVDKDDVVPEEYTTYFRSVIIFGKARIITDEKEFRSSIELLGNHFNPTATSERLETVINNSFNNLCMISIDIEHITGKEANELVK